MFMLIVRGKADIGAYLGFWCDCRACCVSWLAWFGGNIGLLGGFYCMEGMSKILGVKVGYMLLIY